MLTVASAMPDNSYVTVWAAAVTGVLGIISTIVTHLLTKHSMRKKVEQDKKNESALTNTDFGEYALQKLSHAEQSLARVKEIGDSIYETVALGKLDAFTEDLSEIARGKIRLEQPVELTNVPIELTKRMKSLSAITLWTNDPAIGARRKRYLELQAYAIRENQVPVRRLFMVSHPDLTTNREQFLTRIISDQKNGVSVRWMREEDWLSCNIAKAPIDFGVWDNKLVWLYERNPKDINREWLAYLIRSETEAKQYMDAFNANWNISSSPSELVDYVKEKI